MNDPRGFTTIAARDAYIDATYPVCKATNSPGVFTAPGGTLVVRFEHVTFHPDFMCEFHTKKKAMQRCMYDGILLCNPCANNCAEDGHPVRYLSTLKEF